MAQVLGILELTEQKRLARTRHATRGYTLPNDGRIARKSSAEQLDPNDPPCRLKHPCSKRFPAYMSQLVIRQEVFAWLKRHKVVTDDDAVDTFQQQVVLADRVSESLQNGWASAVLLHSLVKSQGGAAMDLKKFKEDKGPLKPSQARVLRQSNWCVRSRQETECAHHVQLCLAVGGRPVPRSVYFLLIPFW